MAVIEPKENYTSNCFILSHSMLPTVSYNMKNVAVRALLFKNVTKLQAFLLFIITHINKFAPFLHCFSYQAIYGSF